MKKKGITVDSNLRRAVIGLAIAGPSFVDSSHDRFESWYTVKAGLFGKHGKAAPSAQLIYMSGLGE
jgi:hypothetical protein